MNYLSSIIWIAIALVFARGLFVFDMGPSAKDVYSTASAVCLAGAVVAAALMYLAEKKSEKS